MEEVARFAVLARSGRFTVTDLCEQFGISRAPCAAGDWPGKYTLAVCRRFTPLRVIQGRGFKMHLHHLLPKPGEAFVLLPSRSLLQCAPSARFALVNFGATLAGLLEWSEWYLG